MDDTKREQIESEIRRHKWLIHEYEMRIQQLQKMIQKLEDQLKEET